MPTNYLALKSGVNIERDRGMTEVVQQILPQLGRFFKEGGTYPAGRDEFPIPLVVQKKSSALIVSLLAEHGPRKFVVKKLLAHHSISCSENLCAVNENIRGVDARLAQFLPRFLAYDKNESLVIRAYTPGRSLLDHLRWRLLLPFGGNGTVEPLLRRVGIQLEHLHRVTAAQAGLTRPGPKNRDLLSSLTACWTDPFVAAHLPQEYRSPRLLLDHLPASFFERDLQFVLLSDPQAKNVLVDEAGNVHFIDINYFAGNPAHGLAEFLVSLDRLALRWPPAFRGRIDGWKRVILKAYLDHAPHSAAEDLLFFYPWKLLLMLQAHAAKRFLYRSYLAWSYLRPMRGILMRLRNRSATDSHQATAQVLLG
jgi:hypothetical protein